MTRVFSHAPQNPRIGKVTKDVLEIISNSWPVNPYEVARAMGESGSNKTLSSRYLYHFRKLKQLELIEMKRTGNTYVAWPMDMEKLRVIHDLLRV